MPPAVISFIKKSWPQAMAGALMAAPIHFDLSRNVAAGVFYGLGAFGLIGLFFEIWTEAREPAAQKWTVNRYRSWFAIIFGAVVLSVCSWIFWPVAANTSGIPLVISEEFERARRPGLGTPLGKIESTTGIYQASHEHALIVSFQPTQTIFVFPKDAGKKAIQYRYLTTDEDRKWWDEAFLRSRFQPPKDKSPPEFRVVEMWDRNPSQWKWVGWREWSCPFTFETFYYQRTENGIIIGVLPTEERLGSSQILTFANNGDWSSTQPIDKIGGASAPACNKNTVRVNGIPIHGHFTKPSP